MSNKIKGKYKFILALDVETNGFKRQTLNASEGYQIVSWGIVIADAITFKPIEELYIEVQWNDEMKAKRLVEPSFGKEAERIHGLTMEYLDKNGIPEEQAVEKVGTLIMKYFGPTNPIRCLGHNLHLFDYTFLVHVFLKYGITIPMTNVHIDTSTLGKVVLGTYTSDQLFETLGFQKRDKHNALDDARMSLKACEIISTLWKSKVGLMYNE